MATGSKRRTSETRLRKLTIILLVLCGVALVPGHRDATSVEAGMAAGGQEASLRDVRLRKIHFVRPDLLQFPVAYDVQC